MLLSSGTSCLRSFEGTSPISATKSLPFHAFSSTPLAVPCCCLRALASLSALGPGSSCVMLGRPLHTGLWGCPCPPGSAGGPCGRLMQNPLMCHPQDLGCLLAKTRTRSFCLGTRGRWRSGYGAALLCPHFFLPSFPSVYCMPPAHLYASAWSWPF